MALVLIAAIVPLLPTLRNGFVYDDGVLLGAPGAGFPRLLVEDLFGTEDGHAASGYWRPLTSLTYFVESKAWGDRPLGYHVDNLALHAADSALLYGVIGAIPPLAPYALCASLLFAAHPVHAESIALITGRTDPLGMLFALLAALALLRGRRALALLAFAAALGCKESIVAVLPLLALLPASRGDRRGAWTFALGAIALVGAFFAVKVLALHIVPPSGAWTGAGTLAQRFLTFLAALPHYAGLLAWPASLSIVHALPLVESASDPRWIAGALILVALLACMASKHRALAAGAALFLLPLLPASNLVPITYSMRFAPFPLFERYLYVPSAGFALLVAALAAGALATRLDAARALRAATIAAGAAAVALGARMWARALDFESDRTLFASAAETTAGDVELEVQAAVWRHLQGDSGGALAELERIRAAHPELESARIEWASIALFHVQHHLQEAEALRAAGRDDVAVRRHAMDLQQRVERELNAILERDRNSGRALELMASSQALRGELLAAADLFRRAFETGTATGALVGNFRGVAEQLRQMGKLEAARGSAGIGAAILRYERGLRAVTGAYPPTALPPPVRDIALIMYCELADQCAVGGRIPDARSAYRRILDLDPSQSRAHEGLAYLADQEGKPDEAKREWEEALRLDPEAIMALQHLRALAERDGRTADAAGFERRIAEYFAKHR